MTAQGPAASKRPYIFAYEPTFSRKFKIKF